MKRIHVLAMLAVATLAGVGAYAARTSGQADNKSSMFVTEVPPRYRDFKLVSVAREEGTLDDVRAILGNDVAIKAYREGKPFPDGTIIVRLAWSFDASEENDRIFGKHQSHVAGAPKNGVQFMVKDSKKFAPSGGWGYGQFNDGKTAQDSVLETCFPCHQNIASRDYVFTRYAP